MIYEYVCEGCSGVYEIIKPVAKYDSEELCPVSAVTMVKLFSRTQLYNTAVQDRYFHPAFGEVVKGDNHARQLARDRGYIELGNERAEKHLKPQRSEYDF